MTNTNPTGTPSRAEKLYDLRRQLDEAHAERDALRAEAERLRALLRERVIADARKDHRLALDLLADGTEGEK